MSFIVKLYLSGMDSFTSSFPWIEKVTGTLFCPRCHNVYETVKELDAVVDRGTCPTKTRRTDLDLIAVNCGSVQLFSTRFIEVVGESNVKATAYLGHLYDVKGFEHERYRTIVAKSDPVVIRGPAGSSIKLCSGCRRLLYWPIGGEYVLRAGLPRLPFFVSDGQTFCTARFYEERIRNAKLVRVAARKIEIRDAPADDFPGDLEALKEELRKARAHGQENRPSEQPSKHPLK